MQIDYAQLKAKSAEVAQAIADVRSTRNVMSRARAEAGAERVAEGGRRRRKALKDREAEAFLKRRIRIRMPEGSRPRTGGRTPRRLFHRLVARMLKGKTGTSNARGPDGLHAVHYAVVARGFSSTSGRRWRLGEVERAALYTVREDALEGGEHGWWTNIADDRNELVAWCRALEAVEKHDRANANVYITEIIALPAEFTARQRRYLVKRICDWFEKRGLAYVVGIHLPDAAGDQRNFHLHVVFSTRPCGRVAPYEWEFAAAKQTDINTPDGIRARRSAIVRDINATLHAAHIDKRYTPLSNRARGMEPPTRGKVGQAATWSARRLVAQEHRQRRLVALGEHVQRLRQGLGEVATRMRDARTNVARRCTDMLLRVEDVSGTLPTLTAARERVSRAINHRMSGITELAAASSGELVRVRTAVQTDLDAKARRARSFAAGSALADARDSLLDAMKSNSLRVGAVAEAASVRLERQRQHLAKVEQERRGRTIGDTRQTPGGALPPAEAAPPSKPLVPDGFAAAREAAAARERELCDIALARLKERRAAVRRDENGLFTVDMAGLQHPEREALMRPAFAATLQDRLLAMFHEAVPTIGTRQRAVGGGDQPIARPFETTAEDGVPAMPVSDHTGKPDTERPTLPAHAGPDVARSHDRPSAQNGDDRTNAPKPASAGILDELGRLEAERRNQKQALGATEGTESMTVPNEEVGRASSIRLPGSHGPGDGAERSLRGSHRDTDDDLLRQKLARTARDRDP